ncbi:MAG: alpha/beta hydrolase [Candidatus Berkelbacteria bacterium]
MIDSAGLPDTRIRPLLKKNISKVISKIGKAFTNSEKSKMFFYNLIKEKDYASASPIMQKTMANLISIDLTKSLAKIKIPTIIIWGEKDKTTPLYMAKILENNIANSELIILPNANHSPHFTHSKVIAKIINEKINF